MSKTCYIDKATNTFADNLAAFGLAYVLNAIADGRAEVSIEDSGAAFAINCEPGIQPEWVESRQPFVGAPFLVTTKNGQRLIKGTDLQPSQLPPVSEVRVDYEEEKKVRREFRRQRDLLYQEAKRSHSSIRAPIDFSGLTAPHQDIDVFDAVNTPQFAIGYNNIVSQWWLARSIFQDVLLLLLDMTSVTPNRVKETEMSWRGLCRAHNLKADVTALSLFNPSQAKGTNNSKAVWKSPKETDGFFLMEWLRLTGLYHGGITRKVYESDDRKTYVLVPKRLSWSQHLGVMKRFRQLMAGSATAIKLDVLVALRYTKALLAYLEEARSQLDLPEDFQVRPDDLVSGMSTAFYKSLGQSPAVMNMASINLPRWVRAASLGALARLTDALEEHIRIVNGLDETRGDQYAMLNDYRDFLSANDLAPFFAFTNAYGAFVMSQYERRKPVRPFTTTNLEVLFMNSDDAQGTFSQILNSEGFKNIAYAIRHSTVTPQGRKAKGNRPAVNIRYGLGQQLARKAAYKPEFLAEVSEFAHLYNAENAQLHENGRNPFRKNITTTDIEELVKLVDQFGSKVVCNMLVAYGYAREPYQGEDDSEPIPAEEIVPETDDDSEDDDE